MPLNRVAGNDKVQRTIIVPVHINPIAKLQRGHKDRSQFVIPPKESNGNDFDAKGFLEDCEYAAEFISWAIIFRPHDLTSEGARLLDFKTDPYEPWQLLAEGQFFKYQCEFILLKHAVDQTEATPKQLAALKLVQSLDDSFQNSIDDAAEQNRVWVDGRVDLASEGLGGINRANIRDHYSIFNVRIPRQDGDSLHYFLGCGCDWEEEHNMNMLVRDMDIVFCGQSDCSFDWRSMEVEIAEFRSRKI